MKCQSEGFHRGVSRAGPVTLLLFWHSTAEKKSRLSHDTFLLWFTHGNAIACSVPPSQNSRQRSLRIHIIHRSFYSTNCCVILSTTSLHTDPLPSRKGILFDGLVVFVRSAWKQRGYTIFFSFLTIFFILFVLPTQNRVNSPAGHKTKKDATQTCIYLLSYPAWVEPTFLFVFPEQVLSNMQQRLYFYMLLLYLYFSTTTVVRLDKSLCF